VQSSRAVPASLPLHWEEVGFLVTQLATQGGLEEESDWERIKAGRWRRARIVRAGVRRTIVDVTEMVMG
jgi:hypothetical protein